MGSSNSLGRLIVAAGMGFAALSTGAHAGLVEIKFQTTGSAITGGCGATGTAFTCLSTALGNAGIPWSTSNNISGRFYYEDTTPGTAATPANFTARSNYNNSVKTLQVSIGSWLSQSLTAVVDGDIQVTNNQGINSATPNPLDRVLIDVNGFNAAISGRFNYSFSDPITGVVWQLDQFLMDLVANPPGTGIATAPGLFTSTALPDESQWESTTWTARNVSLRFNPVCSAANNNPPGCSNTNRDIDGGIAFLAVPEPASLALLGIALAGLGWGRRRRVRS